MLRDSGSVAGLCEQCHEAKIARRTHANGALKAHLSGAGASGGLNRTLAGPQEETRECMACHDGSVAKDAGSHRLKLDSDLGSSDDHPVGIAYRSNTGRQDPVILKDASRIDHRVRLFSATVGCGSCHSIYSREKSLLVMNNSGSRLCLQCHQL